MAMPLETQCSDSTDSATVALAPLRGRARRKRTHEAIHSIQMVFAKLHGIQKPPPSWGIEFTERAIQTLKWWEPERQRLLYRSLAAMASARADAVPERSEIYRLDEDEVIVVMRRPDGLTIEGFIPCRFFNRGRTE